MRNGLESGSGNAVKNVAALATQGYDLPNDPFQKCHQLSARAEKGDRDNQDALPVIEVK